MPHTPGPWDYHRIEIGHEDNWKNPIVSGPANYIARMFCETSMFAGMTSRAPDFETAEANARLIAAAPALLAACQAFLVYDADAEGDDVVSMLNYGEAKEKAVAAIKKATGT